jgi:hypothetical protein
MILLPYRMKMPGVVLVVCGLVLSYANMVKHFEFKSLTIPVLAVFSWFSDAKLFVIMRSNLTNEIAITAVLAGLVLLVFSKEKDEAEGIMALRYRAMFTASIIHMVYLFLITFFTYGLAYIIMITAGTVSIFLIYLAIFNMMLKSFRRKAG